MILLLLFLAILSFWFLVLKHRSQNNNINPPPGPKGLPIIGNLHQFDPSKPHMYFAKLAQIYGPILSLRLGSKQAVVVQSAKTAKEVLYTQDLNFCYRPSKLGPLKLSYNGLDITFAYSFDYLRDIKKFCFVHLFNAKKVESLAQIRQEEVLRMISKISLLSLSSQTVNLSEVVMSFASSNICRTAFGNRYDDDDDDEGSKRSRFHRLLHEAQAMFTTFFIADYFPYIAWLDKLTRQSSRLEKTFKGLDTFYEQIINDHLHPHRIKSEQQDLIDVMLNLRRQHTFTFDLTLDHMKAILMNVIVGGTNTNAAMIVWTMTELIKNPTYMKKVQDELRNSTTENNNKGYISMEDVPKLKYLKAVVKETLRFHPAAPLLIVRETLEKCNIQGYDIQPKTLMFVNVWAISRDPECWTEPEKFNPERFMGGDYSVDYKGQDFEFIPFGAGRKMCPGMILAVATIEVALANLLYSFDWELPYGIKVEDIDNDTSPGITMHKRTPLCLVPNKFP